MKKGLKNSLVTLGLTGALALAGCQNPTYWSVYSQRGTPQYRTVPEIYNTSTRISFEKDRLTYPSEGRIEVPVKESKTDYIEETIVKTTPIQTINWTAQQRPKDPVGLFIGYTLQSAFTVGIVPLIDLIKIATDNPQSTEFYKMSARQYNQKKIKGTEKITFVTLERNDVVNDSQKRYTKNSNGPARNISVEIEAPYFYIDGEKNSSTKRTDYEGKLKTTVAPQQGYLSSQQAEEFSRGIIQETYKPEKLEEILSGLKFLKEETKTVRLETKDDALELQYSIFHPIDPRQEINNRIKSQLEEHLKEKFPLKEINIEVREKDSRIFLENIRMESRQVSGPNEETVLKEEKEFLGKYFNFESDVESLSIDPNKYLSAIPEEIEFSKKIKGTINKGSVYEVEFTHPGHYAASQKIDFESKENPLPVKMARLPAPTEIRETKKGSDESTIGKEEEEELSH